MLASRRDLLPRGWPWSSRPREKPDPLGNGVPRGAVVFPGDAAELGESWRSPPGARGPPRVRPAVVCSPGLSGTAFRGAEKGWGSHSRRAFPQELLLPHQERGDAMKRMSQYWLVVVFTLLVGVVGLTGGPLVLTASAVSPSALVIDVQSFGQTYGEWSARWWQWAFSIPAAVNPVLDLTGENCGQGQTGNVWFLAGTFGGPATRTCTIPTGKGIFFPVLNIATFAPFPYETLNDLRAQAATEIDKFTVLEVTIDHVKLRGLRDLRVQSPVFSLTVPAEGLLGPGSCPPLVPPASPSQLCNPVVSDGFWVLLSPLHKGHHVLHFHAEKSDGFLVDVTYNLTIE